MFTNLDVCMLFDSKCQSIIEIDFLAQKCMMGTTIEKPTD